MEADGAPKFSYAVCSRCGRVPKARALPLYGGEVGEEEDILERMLMKWNCCGASFPVGPDQVVFWCQVYLVQDHYQRRMG